MRYINLHLHYITLHYIGGTEVVHPYCDFSLRRQMAPQQTAKFRTSRVWQFRSTLRKDSVANYESIWTQFPPSVRGLDVLYNVLKVS